MEFSKEITGLRRINRDELVDRPGSMPNRVLPTDPVW